MQWSPRLLGNERVEGRLRFRRRPNWARVVLGVAWLRCQRTRSGMVVFHRHCLLPRWPLGFGGRRQHPVWQGDLLDVDVCVGVPFSALGFLEG